MHAFMRWLHKVNEIGIATSKKLIYFEKFSEFTSVLLVFEFSEIVYNYCKEFKTGILLV